MIDAVVVQSAEAAADEAVRLLAADLPVHLVFADARLYIERPLPFLLVHRAMDATGGHLGRFVESEPSHLLTGPDADLHVLLRRLAAALSSRFGAFLALELWAAEPGRELTIVAPEEAMPRATVETLLRTLRGLQLPDGPLSVRVLPGARCSPEAKPLLLEPVDLRRHGAVLLGLAIPPVHVDPLTGDEYPLVARALHRGLSGALQQALATFLHVQTPHRTEHYRMLGRGRLPPQVWRADAQLTDVSDAMRFLEWVTPLNVDESWDELSASGFRKEPTFHYRLLTTDPERLKRQLYAARLDTVHDPALSELLIEKRNELDRQATMLRDRGTRRFYWGSLQLYGEVGRGLLALAGQMLDVGKAAKSEGGDQGLGALALAQRAREEIALYREAWPQATAEVEVRDDVPGVMVSNGRLLIGQHTWVPQHRVVALVDHEVGTHLLTRWNGHAQRLSQLWSGLPGYEEVQEGTAVLAEHLAGGLTRARLRVLAARVIAVQRLIEGRTLLEVHEELTHEHRFAPRAAFMMAMRVFRGGGLTKDAVYLRGLVWVLEHLRKGGDPLDLWFGKVSADALPLVHELRWRGVLTEPPLRPRSLDRPDAARRLARLRQGMTPLDLMAEAR